MNLHRDNIYITRFEYQIESPVLTKGRLNGRNVKANSRVIIIEGKAIKKPKLVQHSELAVFNIKSHSLFEAHLLTNVSLLDIARGISRLK